VEKGEKQAVKGGLKRGLLPKESRATHVDDMNKHMKSIMATTLKTMKNRKKQSEAGGLFTLDKSSHISSFLDFRNSGYSSRMKLPEYRMHLLLCFHGCSRMNEYSVNDLEKGYWYAAMRICGIF
jgi:hypothetical protein